MSAPLLLLLIVAPAEITLLIWHYSGYRKGGRYDQ